MAYSEQQQALIDKATLKATNAQTAYDSAVIARDSAYRALQDRFNNKYLGSRYYNGQATLQDQLAFGAMNDQSCKTTTGRDACRTAVFVFNSAYQYYKNTSADVATRASELEQAQKDLAKLTGNLQNITNADPNVVLAQSKRQYIFYGAVILILAGLAYAIFGKHTA